MRSQLQLSSLSSLFALLVLSGCNTAYRQAMAQAEEAAVRGDFMTAAHAYRDACRASPDDEKACSRAATFAQKATDQAIATARPACDAGDLNQCLPPLLAARELIPDHPEVNAMLERASQVQVEHCSQWKVDGPLTVATAGVVCLQSRASQLPVASYQSLLNERGNQLASRFAQLAGTAQGQSTSGAASVLWSTARCLSPSTEVNSRAEQARQAFLSESAIPVGIRVDGRIPPDIARALSGLCESMSQNLAPAARCAERGVSPGQPTPLEIRVNALIQGVAENVSEDVRSVHYLAGTRQVRNPAFHAARERLKEADRRVREGESIKSDKDRACEQSKHTHDASCVGCTEKKKTPCDEAKEFAEDLRGRYSERDNARNALNNTPETVTENVYDDFMYSVLTHRWSSNYRFTLRSSSPGSAPTAEQAGELHFEDQEHVGFSPGGLAPDPLVVPGPDVFANAFVGRVAPSVFAEVQRDSMARGAARRGQCSALPADWGLPWAQCWAEASLWESGREPQVTDFLGILASSAGVSDQPLCR